MAFDIYGNDLRRGYCEVHPYVQQEYPCEICCRDRRKNDQDRKQHDKQRTDYYKALEMQGHETVRVVINECLKRILKVELDSESLDIDFNGCYLIQIQKQEDESWIVTNAMNGHGQNCYDQFKEHEVNILIDKN